MHLCEIENPQDLPNLEFPFNVRKGRPLLVAVKILRPDASKNARCVRSPPDEPALFSFCFYSSSLLFRLIIVALMDGSGDGQKNHCTTSGFV